MKSKAARLRELISKSAVMMPGVPNASMARQVEQAGFDAVYVSGAGVINSTAGMPDIGLLKRDEVVKLAEVLRRLAGMSGDERRAQREIGDDDGEKLNPFRDLELHVARDTLQDLGDIFEPRLAVDGMPDGLGFLHEDLVHDLVDRVAA